jgi:pimeloyl-ACP methyl ester carboxylesterase
MSDAPDVNRRRFCAAAATTVAASQLGLVGVSRRILAMTDVLTEVDAPEGSASPDIRPFRVSFPDAELVELRRRVNGTRWAERETVADATQGVQLETTRQLARYWGSEHDWRKCETKLNALPQFITNIDGLDFHFIQVRSQQANALPLIVTHGWPGSVIEQLKIIEPLTNPTAHGASASDAFDIVIPSLPGYGFSGKPTAPGWDVPRIARAWVTLMTRLGYTQFVAQGGDWGNAVTETMALMAPPGLLGVSTNMPATVPEEISRALASGAKPPATLSAEERHAWDQLNFFYKDGLGYANEMSLRPQTLSGIVDSPVGLAAWMLDHDAASYALIARVFAGGREGLTRDDILDNVTLYWLTNTAISSARLYWDSHRTSKGGFFDVRGVKLPMVVTVFPDEIYAAPRSWAERAYSNMIYYKRHEKGCHFAAWEQPDLLTEDLRVGFRPLRKQLAPQRRS